MKLSIKNISIFTGLLFIILTVGFYFISQKAAQEKAEKKVDSVIKPQIPNYLKDTIEPGIVFQKSDFKFPSTLPVASLAAKPSISEAQIIEMAKRLDFPKSPIVAQDAKLGKVYIFNGENNSSLTITPSINHVSYYAGSSNVDRGSGIVNKQLSDASFIQTATGFLADKIGIQKENFTFSDFVYLTPERGTEGLKQTTKDNAVVIQTNFSPLVSQYPILTLNPLETVYSVQILKDGNIAGAEIDLIGNITTEEGVFPVKNFEEFTASLKQSVLISVNDGNLTVPDLNQNKITNIKVESVSISYLLTGDSVNKQTLSPVFVLKGKISVENNQNQMNAILYLPAFSDNVKVGS